MGKASEARRQASRLIRAGLSSPIVTDWVGRRKRLDLPAFLTELSAAGPEVVLADPQGGRDAHEHLMARWPETVTRIARPETLPDVVRRREQVRLHPMAPLSTAALASGGSVWVLGAGLTTPMEALGLVGVVAFTAAGASIGWRPRARSADRKFTLHGTAALVARAQSEMGANNLLALGAGPDAVAATEAHLTRLVAASNQLEALESQAVALELMDGTGAVRQAAQTPAELAMVHEIVARRADLVHALVCLGTLGQREGARLRSEEREGYGLPPMPS